MWHAGPLSRLYSDSGAVAEEDGFNTVSVLHTHMPFTWPVPVDVTEYRRSDATGGSR